MYKLRLFKILLSPSSCPGLSSNVYYNYTGTMYPVPVTVRMCSSIMIRFVSDYSMEYSGFSLSFNTSFMSYNASSGNIMSRVRGNSEFCVNFCDSINLIQFKLNLIQFKFNSTALLNKFFREISLSRRAIKLMTILYYFYRHYKFYMIASHLCQNGSKWLLWTLNCIDPEVLDSSSEWVPIFYDYV